MKRNGPQTHSNSGDVSMTLQHLFAGSCLAALLLIGCGDGGGNQAKLYEVHGVVTYNGEPVPYGEITFEPDDRKGNKGPVSTGVIENGIYAIDNGKGVISGDLRVRIAGYDGNPPPGGGTMPHGMALFGEYSTTVVQPEDSATHDFVIKGK